MQLWPLLFTSDHTSAILHIACSYVKPFQYTEIIFATLKQKHFERV